MRNSDVSKVQAKVAHALLRACVGTDLAVSSPSGLSGGSIIGEAIEAYVVTEPPLGYQVEMWTHTGDDAYRVAQFTTLDAAITCALRAASGPGPIAAIQKPPTLRSTSHPSSGRVDGGRTCRVTDA